MATKSLQVDRAMRGQSSGAGFSLFELVAVMVVVAIMAVVAVPSLSNLGDTRSAMAGRQLLGALTFARQRAIATGTRCWLVFDTASETWSVLDEDPDNPGRAGAAVITDPATGQPYVQSLGVDEFVGVEIQSASFDGDDEVGFDWLGRPLNESESSLAADGSVVLSASHSVTVTAGTGHIAYVAP